MNRIFRIVEKFGYWIESQIQERKWKLYGCLVDIKRSISGFHLISLLIVQSDSELKILLPLISFILQISRSSRHKLNFSPWIIYTTTRTYIWWFNNRVVHGIFRTIMEHGISHLKWELKHHVGFYLLTATVFWRLPLGYKFTRISNSMVTCTNISLFLWWFHIKSIYIGEIGENDK